MNDNSIMPFGKYKGSKLANIPADYLIYIFDKGIARGDLKNYIVENMDVLQSEIKEDEF